MIDAAEFAPGRLVLPTGERVRLDPSGAPILLADYDALSADESAECELAMHRMAQAGLATAHIQRRLDLLAEGVTKRKGGAPWTEEQYREAGIQLLHLRMRPDVHEPLDELADLWGLTRGAAAKRAIAEAHARHVAPYGRPPVEQAPDESTILTREPLNNRSGGRKSDKSKP